MSYFMLSCPQAWRAVNSQRVRVLLEVPGRNMSALGSLYFSMQALASSLAQLASSSDCPFCRGLMQGHDRAGLIV